MEYTAILSRDKFESYVSEDYYNEKIFKVMKMMFSGHPVRINPEERYVLFETTTGGYDIALAYNDNTFVGLGLTVSAFTSLVNKIDDKLLEEQFVSACAGIALRSYHMKNRRKTKTEQEFK